MFIHWGYSSPIIWRCAAVCLPFAVSLSILLWNMEYVMIRDIFIIQSYIQCCMGMKIGLNLASPFPPSLGKTHRVDIPDGI